MKARQELDPVPYLRSARERLVRLRQDQFRSAFGVGLRDVVECYAAEHPGARLRFLRYIRAIDGKVDVLLDSGAPVPAEDRIVHLTSSVSAADADRLSIVAEVLIATNAER